LANRDIQDILGLLVPQGLAVSPTTEFKVFRDRLDNEDK
jgi:hypothetical protein